MSQHVVVAIPVLLIGGTEVQTLNLVRVLVESGYTVTVCCYYEFDQVMVSMMEEAGAKVVLMGLNRSTGLLHLFKKLVEKFKKLKPNIVHVQYVAPGFIPIIASRFAGIKNVIATVHQPGQIYGWKARLLLRFGARLCKAFFCVSRSTEESWFGDSAPFDPELYKKGRNHFTIYNAVDTERIAREASSENVVRLRTALSLEDKKVVGFVGRLRWEKGPSVLIAAFAKVVQEISEAMLLVVGDGPDRQNLENLAQKLGINANIIWLGQKKQHEVFQLYGVMDVVAIPSFFEGFGLTAAEAMAGSVPVVASNVDGLREVVINKYTGILIPVDNHEAMADAIIEILVQPEQIHELGIAGCQRVAESFSVHQFEKNIVSAYKIFSSQVAVR